MLSSFLYKQNPAVYLKVEKVMANNPVTTIQDVKIQKIKSTKTGTERTFYAVEVPSTQLLFIEPESSADLAVLDDLAEKGSFVPELTLHMRGKKNMFSAKDLSS
jgi:hypothetical protein